MSREHTPSESMARDIRVTELRKYGLDYRACIEHAMTPPKFSFTGTRPDTQGGLVFFAERVWFLYGKVRIAVSDTEYITPEMTKAGDGTDPEWTGRWVLTSPAMGLHVGYLTQL